MLILGLIGASLLQRPLCLDEDWRREYVGLSQMEVVNYRLVYHPVLANYLISQGRLCVLTSLTLTSPYPLTVSF